jgi:mRNA-degrading endonuclease RelE of RelBE toxin-antitoxin system
MVAEINNENVRELSLYSYRIIYQIKNDKVFVLAVVHKKRDLKPEDVQQ